MNTNKSVYEKLFPTDMQMMIKFENFYFLKGLSIYSCTFMKRLTFINQIKNFN